MRTRLVTDAEELEALSVDAVEDERTALARGLAEYLASVSLTLPAGGVVRFKKTFHTWAEGEESSEFPSAVITANDPGDFDASELSPQIIELSRNQVLSHHAEFIQNIMIESACTSVAERRNVSMLLTHAFNPVTWMYGFRLVLPHYHNAVASFALLTSMQSDNEDDARRRSRKLVHVVEGRVPVLIARGVVPNMRPRVQLTVEGSDSEST